MDTVEDRFDFDQLLDGLFCSIASSRRIEDVEISKQKSQEALTNTMKIETQATFPFQFNLKYNIERK